MSEWKDGELTEEELKNIKVTMPQNVIDGKKKDINK